MIPQEPWPTLLNGKKNNPQTLKPESSNHQR